MRQRTHTARLALLLSLLLAGLADASATAVRGAPMPGAAGSAAAAATTTSARRPAARKPPESLDLVNGVIHAVDRQKKTISIDGRVLGLHPKRLHVFRAGSAVGTDALTVGTRVRFALGPAAAEPREVVLIYIESRP